MRLHQLQSVEGHATVIAVVDAKRSVLPWPVLVLIVVVLISCLFLLRRRVRAVGILIVEFLFLGFLRFAHLLATVGLIVRCGRRFVVVRSTECMGLFVVPQGGRVEKGLATVFALVLSSSMRSERGTFNYKGFLTNKINIYASLAG